ncbi:MAG TPA: hypothetical protein VE403_04830 [Sphingomicrobium sp.]|nr:hypothetical protein [Sphingomicrobium sp.]
MADVAPIVVFRDAHRPWRGSENDARNSQGSFDRTSADYWRGRERAERAAAKRARSPLARAVHQELAQEYAARVRGIEGSTTSQGQR